MSSSAFDLAMLSIRHAHENYRVEVCYFLPGEKKVREVRDIRARPSWSFDHIEAEARAEVLRENPHADIYFASTLYPESAETKARARGSWRNEEEDSDDEE